MTDDNRPATPWELVQTVLACWGVLSIVLWIGELIGAVAP